MRHNRRDDGQLSCQKREMKTMNTENAVVGHTTGKQMAERGGVPLKIKFFLQKTFGLLSTGLNCIVLLLLLFHKVNFPHSFFSKSGFVVSYVPLKIKFFLQKTFGLLSTGLNCIVLLLLLFHKVNFPHSFFSKSGFVVSYVPLKIKFFLQKTFGLLSTGLNCIVLLLLLFHKVNFPHSFFSKSGFVVSYVAQVNTFREKCSLTSRFDNFNITRRRIIKFL